MRAMLTALAALIAAPATHADTMTELHGCLQDCFAIHADLSWDFHLCVRDCLEDWEAQKGAVNIAFDPASTGYGSLYGLPILHPAAGELVTTVFTISSDDPLLRIELYLHTGGPLPPPPAFGDLVGFDDSGDDGWAITFDPSDLGDYAGLLVARAQFAGHDEEIDGDQAVIPIGTTLPPGLPPHLPLDVSASTLTLSAGDDGVVVGILNHGLAVAADFSPGVPIAATVAVNGAVVHEAILTPEVVAGVFDCYIEGPPCTHACPFGHECKTLRIEVDREAYDICMCDLIGDWLFEVPAAPGDLVLVRLDADNAWAEAIEANNTASARVPQVTAAGAAPGSRVITAVANHPNPFNPRTVFTFSLEVPAAVRVEVLDLRGALVRELVGGRFAAGFNRVEWDGLDARGRPAAAGVYRYRIHAGGDTATGTMSVIR